MTQATLAIVVAEDGTRYEVKNWRNGSHETSSPSRPARILLLSDEKGWCRLEEWNGAVSKSGSLYKPKDDTKILREALSRIKQTYGKNIEEIHYRRGNETNHLGTPLGYRGSPLSEFPAEEA